MDGPCDDRAKCMNGVLNGVAMLCVMREGGGEWSDEAKTLWGIVKGMIGDLCKGTCPYADTEASASEPAPEGGRG